MTDGRQWPWHAKVQAERERRGWSYSHLARLVGEEVSQVSRWLRREVRPRSEVVPKFAKALGWPLAYLLDDAQAYPPSLDGDWRMAILEGLDEPRRKLIAALADDGAVAYLTQALAMYEELRDKLQR